MDFLGICYDFPRVTYGFPWDSLRIPKGLEKDSLRSSLGLLKDFLRIPYGPMGFPKDICITPLGNPMDSLWMSSIIHRSFCRGYIGSSIYAIRASSRVPEDFAWIEVATSLPIRKRRWHHHHA